MELDPGPFVYLVEGDNAELKSNDKKALKVEEVKLLADYVSTLTAEEKGTLKSPKYFYEVEFNKPGGMIMPILVEITYEDGTVDNL